MIENMYSILQRINELKSRFGLNAQTENTHPQKTASISYDEVEAQAIRSLQKSETVSSQRHSIEKIAETQAQNNKVSPSLIKAMINVESGYNNRAVSPKGAKGLMQLMPSIVKEMGIENPFSPEENIRGGVTLMKNLLNRYDGDYKKALAAYNAGPGAVSKYNGVPDYKETQDYVKKVIDSYLQNKE